MPRLPHHCHAIGCGKPCPPKYLMCAPCWALVPADLAAEVYRTVVLRRKNSIDETWAPWWRAAHRAIDHVFRAKILAHPDVTAEQRAESFAWADRALAKDMKFADELEADPS